MSETALPQPANARPASSSSFGLWQAILLRSAVTLAFGLVTVFWAQPGRLGLSVAFACYFLAFAVAQYLTIRALNFPRGDARRLVLQSATALLAMSGVVVAIATSTAVIVWFSAAALAVVGIAELYAARYKPSGHKTDDGGREAVRNDWLISAILGLATALLLPFFLSAGEHSLMGVVGGGALMSGALWVLSGLTLRHDGSKSKAQ